LENSDSTASESSSSFVRLRGGNPNARSSAGLSCTTQTANRVLWSYRSSNQYECVPNISEKARWVPVNPDRPWRIAAAPATTTRRRPETPNVPLIVSSLGRNSKTIRKERRVRESTNLRGRDGLQQKRQPKLVAISNDDGIPAGGRKGRHRQCLLMLREEK
jgi:hypothetical protein